MSIEIIIFMAIEFVFCFALFATVGYSVGVLAFITVLKIIGFTAFYYFICGEDFIEYIYAYCNKKYNNEDNDSTKDNDVENSTDEEKYECCQHNYDPCYYMRKYNQLLEKEYKYNKDQKDNKDQKEKENVIIKKQDNEHKEYKKDEPSKNVIEDNLLNTSLEEQYKTLKSRARKNPKQLKYLSNDIRDFKKYHEILQKYQLNDDNQRIIKYHKNHNKWFFSKKCLPDLFTSGLIRKMEYLQPACAIVRLLNNLFQFSTHHYLHIDKKFHIILFGDDLAITVGALLSFFYKKKYNQSCANFIDCIVPQSCKQLYPVKNLSMYYNDSPLNWIKVLQEDIDKHPDDDNLDVKDVILVNFQPLINLPNLTYQLRRCYPKSRLHTFHILEKSLFKMNFVGFSLANCIDKETNLSTSYLGYSPWINLGVSKLQSFYKKRHNQIRRSVLVQNESIKNIDQGIEMQEIKEKY